MFRVSQGEEQAGKGTYMSKPTAKNFVFFLFRVILGHLEKLFLVTAAPSRARRFRDNESQSFNKSVKFVTSATLSNRVSAEMCKVESSTSISF